MIVDETGDHRATAEIDDFHTRVLAIDGVAYRQEAVIANPYGIDCTVRGIHGEDLAVGEHEILAAGAGIGGVSKA